MEDKSQLRANHRYAWFVLSASFFIVFLSYGFRMSFGVYLKPMISEFGWDRASISLAASLNVFVYGLLAPFMGKLLDKYGAKMVISLSVIVLGGSVASLSLVKDLFTLYLIFGFLMAFALGGSSIVTNSALITKWFVKKRGLALGLLSSGASLGQLTLVPIITYMILVSGWRFSLLVMGGAILVLLFPTAFFVLKDEPGRSAEAALPGAAVSAPASANPAGVVIGSGSLSLGCACRTMHFWLLAGGYFVCGYTVNLVSTHLPAFITDIGYSPMMAGNLLALTGALNIVGTITMGTVSDRFGSRIPLGIVYLLRGFSIALLLISRDPISLYIFAMIIGFSWFATNPLVVSICSDNFGTRHIGTIYGTLFLSHQIGGALSSYLGGLIFDIRGNYEIAFGSAVALAMIASFLSFSIKEKRGAISADRLESARALS